MTFTTRRILRVAMLRVAMMAAITGIIAAASGCAKRAEPSRPAAAAPDTGSDPQTPASGVAAASADAAPALSADDQVRDALFRYLFAHDGANAQQFGSIYFLGVMEKGKRRDPSRALMRRFAGHRPRVERASLADFSGGIGAVHRYTGEQGVVFTVGEIKRVSDDEVEAECEYYAGNLAASGGTYTVVRKDGVWVVMKPKTLWVS